MLYSPIVARLSAAALIVAVAACGRNTPAPEAAAPEPASAAATAPITVFTASAIYTGVPGEPPAQAVAVSEGEIIAVGTREIVLEAAGDAATIVDIGDGALYPGFTDGHAHLLGIGMRELTLNLEGTPSVAALVETVADNIAQTPAGETLYGRGWIETGWPEARMPTRDDLDPVSPDNPVILERADGHAVVVNTAALVAAGIDDDTADPTGGRIERDASGRATGLLIDFASNLVSGLLQAPSDERRREAYEIGSEVYAAYGWTGIYNVSVEPSDVDIMEEMSDAGALKIRVANAIEGSGLDALIESGPRASANGRIRTNAIKLYLDGALGSRGALLTAPYSDQPGASGLLLMEKDAAMDYFGRALDGGVQVATHAIGDEANTLLLDWYEEAFASRPESQDMRWRDEHTQILHVEDIPRFGNLGIIASMQPSHAIGDLYFAPDRLGPDRLDGAYPWRSLLDAGAVIVGGSDAPVERGDPRIEFYAAVARRGLDGTQTQDWRPAEAVSREEALAMFTSAAAYGAFLEDELGTIEPGKRADFTAFSADIMTIPEADILTVEPILTVVDGEIIFRAE